MERVPKLTTVGKWVWTKGTYSEERTPQRNASADASGQMAVYTGGIGADSDAILDMNLECGWPYPMDVPPELEEAAVRGLSAWHMVPTATTVATTQNTEFARTAMMEQSFLTILDGLDNNPDTEQDLAPRELTAAALVGHEQPGSAAVVNVQDWIPTATGYRYATSLDAQAAHAVGGGRSSRDRGVGRRAQGPGVKLPALSGASPHRDTSGPDGASEWSVATHPRSG